MAISPMHQGDTGPNAQWNFTDDQGDPVILSVQTTFVLCIFDVERQSTRQGAGIWTITNFNPGAASYQWNPQDTAIAGDFKLYVKITVGPNQIMSTKEVPWTVIAVP